MSFAIVGAGIAAAGGAYSIYRGVKQDRDARRLREGAQDPGYEVNQALVDNARMMQERYGNYTLPGYESMRENVRSSASGAFSQGVQGATSSGDVLDLAARIAYGQQQGLNQVEGMNAQGRDQSFMQYMGANAQAGQQYQLSNEYERQRYREQLMEAGALQQAGNVNIGQGIDSLATIGSAMALREMNRRDNHPDLPPVVNNQGSIFGGQQSNTTPNVPINSPQAGANASSLVENEYRKLLRESLMSRATTPSITPLIR